MADSRPLSFTAACVLRSIANGTPYGFEIMDATDLPSGTVYPILARMEQADLVRSRWESAAAARREKRPPRRYYEVTAAGKRALAAAIEHYRTLGGLLAPSWKAGPRG